MTILALLATVGIVGYRRHTRAAREAVLKEDLFQLNHCLEEYLADHGKYPTSLAQLRDDLSYAMERLANEDARPVTALLLNIKIEPRAVAEFGRKLERLAEQYRARGSDSGSAYSLGMGLYPCDRDYGPLVELKIE